jgi:hypothetical protein
LIGLDAAKVRTRRNFIFDHASMYVWCMLAKVEHYSHNTRVDSFKTFRPWIPSVNFVHRYIVLEWY